MDCLPDQSERVPPSRQPDTLWDRFDRERVFPLLAVIVLAEIASVWIIATGGPLLSRLFQEVFLFGLQFGVLSCLGLWMALASQTWTFRAPAVLATVSAAMLVFASFRAFPSAELATMFIGHVVVLAILAFLLRLAGLIRGPHCARGDARLRQYSLRHIFAWMTIVAGLAFLARYAELPLGIDVLFIIGSCPLHALTVAALATHVRSGFLRVATSLLTALLLAAGLTGLTRGDQFEEFLVFHLCQSILVLMWIGIGRASKVRRTPALDRVDHSGLGRKCARLDPAEEQQLADANRAKGIKTWPEY